MCTAEKQTLPWWQKYTLTLEEAAEYFGISYKKLRLFCKSHTDEDFLLWNVRGKLILPSHGREYFTSHSKHNFTLYGKQFFTLPGKDNFTYFCL